MDQFYSTCSTDVTFSLYVICSKSYNTISISAANALYDTTKIGPLTINILNMRNAEYGGFSGPIVVKNYDTVQKKYLSKSWATLTKSYIEFKEEGLEIYLNKGRPWYLEVGTFSDWIDVGANEVMKQRLLLTTLYYDSNFILQGNPITLVPNSNNSQFRFAVPQTMGQTLFYITWLKSGDITQKFYSKIAKLPVYVVKGTLLRTLTIGTTLYGNLADGTHIGKSIPIDISTSYPPYEQVIVTITVTNAQASKISLNDTSIALNRAVELERYYVNSIASTYTEATINLSFALSGTDASSYQLSASTASIPVNPPDLTPATFVALYVYDNTLAYVEMYVKSDKLAYVYCVTG
jgi:hypothetical protein